MNTPNPKFPEWWPPVPEDVKPDGLDLGRYAPGDPIPIDEFDAVMKGASVRWSDGVFRTKLTWPEDLL